MKNENYIKVQKVSNPQKTYYQINYYEKLNCGGINNVKLSYDVSEILKLHIDVMKLEKKLGVKAIYEGFDIKDFQTIQQIVTSSTTIKIPNNNCYTCDTIKAYNDISIVNKNLNKEIEELKNQLFVSEKLNKELYNGNKKLIHKNTQLRYRVKHDSNYINIKYNEHVELIDKYNKIQEKNRNIEFMNRSLQEHICKLELKLSEYKEDSILLDKIHKEYNKTLCISRYVLNGKTYVEEKDYIKLNLELKAEKDKNECIHKHIFDTQMFMCEYNVNYINRLKNTCIRYPGGP